MPGSDRVGPQTVRVAKFALVGVSNTVITLVSYAVLLAIGVHYAVAGALGWTLGLLNGYTWNRLWTFDRAAHRMSLMARYFAVGAVGLGMNTGLLAILVSRLGVEELPAELIALPVVVLTTFLVNRFWVFGGHIRAAAPPVTPDG